MWLFCRTVIRWKYKYRKSVLSKIHNGADNLCLNQHRKPLLVYQNNHKFKCWNSTVELIVNLNKKQSFWDIFMTVDGFRVH